MSTLIDDLRRLAADAKADPALARSQLKQVISPLLRRYARRASRLTSKPVLEYDSDAFDVILTGILQKHKGHCGQARLATHGTDQLDTITLHDVL